MAFGHLTDLSPNSQNLALVMLYHAHASAEIKDMFLRKEVQKEGNAEET